MNILFRFNIELRFNQVITVHCRNEINVQTLSHTISLGWNRVWIALISHFQHVAETLMQLL